MTQTEENAMTVVPLPPADTAAAIHRAECARAAGRHDVLAWQEAVSAASATASVRLHLYASCRLAEALAGQGRRAEALALLQGVANLASDLGVAALGRWAAGLADVTAQPGRAPREAQASPLGQLTQREGDVLALVAEGLTNPQIGRRLYMAPKTASAHVSAILAKLGAATRAEAAARYAAARVAVAGAAVG